MRDQFGRTKEARQRFALRPPKIKLSENDVEKACCDILRLKGYMPVRQHVGLFKTPNNCFIRMGVPGDPDWVAVKHPSFLLEVKRPGGAISEVQLRRHAELRLYGLEVVVVESVEELLECLSRFEHSP